MLLHIFESITQNDDATGCSVFAGNVKLLLKVVASKLPYLDKIPLLYFLFYTRKFDNLIPLYLFILVE